MKKLILTVLSLVLFALTTKAQTHVITGLITGEKRDTLIGTVVIQKGTNNATVTDNNGNFSIVVPDSAVLSIESIGYKSQEIAVGNTTHIHIIMQADEMTEDEVVVVGYSSRRSAKITIRGSRSISSNYTENAEEYKNNPENKFKLTRREPLTTFSIDVDRASYSNVRRFLLQGQKPPEDAVRIEEMINYFDYNYPQPKDQTPFSITTEISECPWNKNHKLLLVGMQGRKIDTEKIPPSNFVFLIDVSGSMDSPDKLPLLKSAFQLLINNLRSQDKVAIVVYAGSSGLVLESTSGSNKQKIYDALESLAAGGSTAGGEGIELAYKVAKENFITGGNNRIILATDGDFNVGIQSEGELERLITNKRESGIFLTCLGFGQGNYKDNKMETLANKGNGNYAYIDNILEAQKTLVSEFGSTMFTIAKDVKSQIEFNPVKVQAYRQIGYENRTLNNEDFKDDKKDAGDLGAGHTVTMLFEYIPAGIKDTLLKDTIGLKYQKNSANQFANQTNEVATIKFRFKYPDKKESIESVLAVVDSNINLTNASINFRFASAVAMSGMLLRKSAFSQESSYRKAIELAENAKGEDKEGYKAEFIKLIKTLK